MDRRHGGRAGVHCGRATGRGRLPRQARPADHSVRSRRLHRHPGAVAGRSAAPHSGPARHRRKQAWRGRRHRCDLCGQGAARRLHAVRRHHQHARHQCQPVQEPEVRPGEGL
ncbi:hypothetical protein G6F68_010383 [Rhizopus microsporus]|nr:hypothetical protein G6F68_010383 [Rhizopus microsporus]